MVSAKCAEVLLQDKFFSFGLFFTKERPVTLVWKLSHICLCDDVDTERHPKIAKSSDPFRLVAKCVAFQALVWEGPHPPISEQAG